MLDGKRILIVEDEALLALDLTFAMEDMGAAVVGPCHRLGSALRVASDTSIDGAILDVDLAGEAVFPLADELCKRHVPFVFHTGRHNPDELSRRYEGVSVFCKPAPPQHVANALLTLIARAEGYGA